MSWLQKHKRVWRLTVLALLFVGLLGPWGFEAINVPAEYPCSAPFIRLEGDFCGEPMSVTGILFGENFNSVLELVTGAYSADVSMGLLPYILFFLLPLLPFFSTLLLILRGDRPRLGVFQVAAWGLAVAFALLYVIPSLLRPFGVLWGIWLYFGVAASALILEVLMLAAGRKPSSSRNPTAAVSA